MKNVKFWKEAVVEGFDPGSYPYVAEKVPMGVVEAMLDGKIWAKRQMGIGCYFTRVSSGERFLLTVYRDKKDQRYRVKGCPIDFACCPVGAGYVYRLEVEVNGKGNAVLRGAVLLGGASSVVVAPAVE